MKICFRSIIIIIIRVVFIGRNTINRGIAFLSYADPPEVIRQKRNILSCAPMKFLVIKPHGTIFRLIIDIVTAQKPVGELCRAVSGNKVPLGYTDPEKEPCQTNMT